jgi:hypothetical protein
MASELVNVKVKPETRDLIKAGKSEGQTYDQVLTSVMNKQGGEGQTSGTTTQEGVVYLSSAGQTFIAPELSVQTLTEMVENPYIAQKLANESLLYFPSLLKVEGKDPKGQVNEDVTNDLRNMLGVLGCALSEKIKQAKYDSKVYGMSFFNPIWEFKDGAVQLTRLRHLPSWSFFKSPLNADTSRIYSGLLQGVIISEVTGEVEYWQTQDSGETIRINNIMTVKNPQDEGLAGDSDVIQLYDIIQMIKFGWNVELQAIARAGAPIFFLKITKAKKATDPGTGGVSDIALGNSIISKWSTKKQFLLRENMEVVSLPLTQKIDVLAPIAVLEKLIDKYFSVTEQVKKEGATIGGNALSELKLLNRAIQSVHSWLLPPFEDLVNQYFVKNMFPPGWSCSITYDVWDTDDRELNIKQVEAAMKGNAVDMDDIRAKCGFDPADDKKRASIEAYNKAKTKAAASLIAKKDYQGDKPDDLEEDDQEDPDNKAPKKGKGPSKKGEAEEEEDGSKTGSGKMLNKRQNKEEEPLLDELGEALYSDLSGHFDKLLGSLSKTLVNEEG